MKRKLSSLVMMTLALSGIFISCEEEAPIDPTSPGVIPKPRTPAAPTARAGNDTTIYLPVTTIFLNGGASTDPDFNTVSYKWVLLADSSSVNLKPSFDSGKAFVSNLVKVGTYEFELTVTDADKLASKDTVKITVAAPPCTSTAKEIIFKNLVWVHPWYTEIQIYNPHAYLPPNSYIKNFYIRRDSSDKWELIVHAKDFESAYGSFLGWLYLKDNKTLIIWPGSNAEDDTPDVKIEYCQ